MFFATLGDVMTKAGTTSKVHNRREALRLGQEAVGE